MTVPLGPLKDGVYETGRNTVVFAFILFIAISSMIGLTVMFMVHPSVNRLQENAKRIAHGEYGAPASTNGKDEIADLSRSFDEMNQRVFERTAILVEGRKMYKFLCEEVPCYLTAVNRECVITRANRAFSAEFGEHVGKWCYVAYRGRSEPCRDCPVDATFRDGRSHQSEETWKTNGAKGHVGMTACCISTM
jgi:histidine kinase